MTHTPIQLAQSSVGTIAAEIPGAARIFRKYRIDFCCGGKGTVAESVDGKFVQAEQVLQELEQLVGISQPQNWNDQSHQNLIDFILERYHQRHREDIRELILLARKVESVHADHPLSPTGLADLLTQVRDALEDHMAKEEQILFPAMLTPNSPPLDGPIHCMGQEHEEHGQRLDQIVQTCHQFELPPEACATWRALYTGCQALIADIMAHINLENHVLFPRFA